MPRDDERPASALIDYVAIVIGPVLIMLMVGSLVFFLIDALYQGNYPERLSYTMVFFVFAAVLIARIGIQEGRGRSMLYVLALGGAVFLAMQAFVQYPPGLLRAVGPLISLGLIALVAWAADKLTWDCTHLDGERDAGGQGLMAATGLAGGDTPLAAEPADDDGIGKKKKPPASTGMLGWVERWNAYREQQKKKPHTPGTWVVYFGLAAIPIFAVGQSLIPASDGFRRRWAFFEMATFVGSGLGLLVTTSLLGLKKYLQDRGARIPGAMTASWLGLGAILIAAFVLVGSLLPRPYSETPLVQFGDGQKFDRNASKYAVVKGKEGGKGDGAKGNKTEAGEGKSTAKGGQAGGKGQSGDAKSGSGSKDGKNGAQGNQKGNDGGGGKSGNDQGKGNGDPKGNDAKSGDQKGNDQKGDESKGGDGKQGEKAGDQKGDGDAAEKTDGEPESNDGNADGGSNRANFGEMLEQIGDGVKWIVWIIVLVAVVVGIFLFVVKFLAPFTAWARNFLDWLKSLFGRKERAADADDDDDTNEDDVERLPPFDSFANPFDDGTATSRPLPDLIRYSYRALESFAADHEWGRTPGETPREFAVRLREEMPQLENVEGLTSLMNRVAYSPRPLPADALATVKAAWAEMDRFAAARS